MIKNDFELASTHTIFIYFVKATLRMKMLKKLKFFCQDRLGYVRRLRQVQYPEHNLTYCTKSLKRKSCSEDMKKKKKWEKDNVNQSNYTDQIKKL